jgi:hypothetical protein
MPAVLSSRLKLLSGIVMRDGHSQRGKYARLCPLLAQGPESCFGINFFLAQRAHGTLWRRQKCGMLRLRHAACEPDGDSGPGGWLY